MLAGQFQSYIRKLNRNVRIYCVSDEWWRPACIFHVVKGEFTEICGIDKNIVPEYSVMNPNGTHKLGGWRRALKILINKGLIDRSKAEKLFRTRLHYKAPRKVKRRAKLPVNPLGSR